MTRRILASLAISFLLASCQSDEPTSTASAPSHILNGQWVFINYWASWCKPCIDEIPEFNQLAASLKDQAQVYAVNYDGVKGEALKQQAQKIGISFPLLEQDPSETMSHSIPKVLPSTYIYNPEGKLHKTLIGPQTLETLKAAMQ